MEPAQSVHPADDETIEEAFGGQPEDNDTAEDELLGAQPEMPGQLSGSKVDPVLWRGCLKQLSLSGIMIRLAQCNLWKTVLSALPLLRRTLVRPLRSLPRGLRRKRRTLCSEPLCRACTRCHLTVSMFHWCVPDHLPLHLYNLVLTWTSWSLHMPSHRWRITYNGMACELVSKLSRRM